MATSASREVSRTTNPQAECNDEEARRRTLVGECGQARANGNQPPAGSGLQEYCKLMTAVGWTTSNCVLTMCYAQEHAAPQDCSKQPTSATALVTEYFSPREECEAHRPNVVAPTR